MRLDKFKVRILRPLYLKKYISRLFRINKTPRWAPILSMLWLGYNLFNLFPKPKSNNSYVSTNLMGKIPFKMSKLRLADVKKTVQFVLVIETKHNLSIVKTVTNDILLL